MWENPPYYLTAYGLAVKHGFTGTEKEFLESLNGTSAYVHIKYSAEQPTKDSDMTDTPSNWLGICTDENETAPEHYTDYVWFNPQGADGDDGVSSYLFLIYSQNYPESDEDLTNDPTGCSWLGWAVSAENSAPTHYTQYNWAKFKGEVGEQGVSVTGFRLVRGNHAAGTMDLYNLELSNGQTIPVEIYNGADGTGAGDMLKSIYDPQGKNTDVFKAIADAVAAAVTSVNGMTGDVTINRVSLADNIYTPDNQEIYDGYIFRTSGGTASIDSGEAHLVLLNGHTIAEGRVEEQLAVTTSTTDLQAGVIASTWRASQLGGTGGNYVFTFASDKWTFGGEAVLLADYGITVTGDPAEGDTVTVNYVMAVRGTLKTATPTAFKSIGLNQFDKANNVLDGYSIDTSGNVVANASTKLCWIHAVGGLENGYTVYSSDNTVIRIGVSGSVPEAGSSGIDVVTSDVGTSHVDVDAPGYICVVTTNPDTLCVHPTWSGYEDATYEAYSESTIPIPTTGTAAGESEETALPTASYGIPSVGSVADELNFDLKTYTKRIGYMAYSAANLAAVQAMDVDYDYDTTMILYVLPQPVVYTLAASVSDSYTAADFGTEEFLDTEISVYAQNLYGQNLRDKLRTDVLTKSAQTLTVTQQLQKKKDLNIVEGNELYDGVDLTQKFALEIAGYSGDPWAWIQARINAGNYTGLRPGDYINGLPV